MLFGARIGAIEFLGDEIRVAVLAVGGRLPTLLDMASATAEYDAPEGRAEALVDALDQALDELSVPPSVYVLCTSGAYAIVRNIVIPFRGRRRVAAAVRYEIEPYLAFPIEELLLDFNIVGEFEGETEVLAIGMRREQLEEQLAVLEEAGVEAEQVTLDAVSLTGLWDAAAKPGKGLHAVLHVREEGASLAVVYNRTLAFFRHIDCTEAGIIEAPGVPAREIQNSLRAFLSKWRGGGEIDAIAVTGADLGPAETHAFSEALGLGVEVAGLPLKVQKTKKDPDGDPESAAPNRWASLAGAALGAARGGFVVDFKRAERDWRGAVKAVVANVTFSAIFAVVALALWAAYYYVGTQRNGEELTRLQREVDEKMEDVEVLGSQGLPTDGGIDTQAFEDPTLLAILKEVSEKMPGEKVRIKSFRMTAPGMRGYWLLIEGQVDSSAVFNEVYAQLQASELFEVEEDPDLSMQADMTEFKIRAYRVGEEEDAEAVEP